MCSILLGYEAASLGNRIPVFRENNGIFLQCTRTLIRPLCLPLVLGDIGEESLKSAKLTLQFQIPLYEDGQIRIIFTVIPQNYVVGGSKAGVVNLKRHTSRHSVNMWGVLK